MSSCDCATTSCANTLSLTDPGGLIGHTEGPTTCETAIFTQTSWTVRATAARGGGLDIIENIPGTHDVDRCLVKAVRRWLAARGIEEFEDLLDGDEAARSPVSLVSEAVTQSGYNMGLRIGFASASVCPIPWN